MKEQFIFAECHAIHVHIVNPVCIILCVYNVNKLINQKWKYTMIKAVGNNVSRRIKGNRYISDTEIVGLVLLVNDLQNEILQINIDDSYDDGICVMQTPPTPYIQIWISDPEYDLDHSEIYKFIVRSLPHIPHFICNSVRVMLSTFNIGLHT